MSGESYPSKELWEPCLGACRGTAQNYCAVGVLGVGMVFPSTPARPYDIPLELGAGTCPAFQCEAAPGRGIIPPSQLRRLGRAQTLALAAALSAVGQLPQDGPFGNSTAVMMGSGLGEQVETAEFLRQMIVSGGTDLRPARFVNSVHNSMASQIAIVLGARGENCTFTHGNVSFEIALESGVQLLNSGRAKMVLTGGVDVLTSYVAAAGRAYGCWRTSACHLEPMAGTGAEHGTIPGEGAAVMVLAGPDAFPEVPRIAQVAGVTVQTLHDSDSFTSTKRAAALVKAIVEASGMPLGGQSFLLFGASGDSETDAHYHELYREISCLAGSPVPCGVYKQSCGEFPTAPALATAVAADMIHRKTVPAQVRLLRPLPKDTAPVCVAVCSLVPGRCTASPASPGSFTVCLLTP